MKPPGVFEAAGAILASELRPLRVNAVSPGVIDRPWWVSCWPTRGRPYLPTLRAKTPVGRVGQAEDVARAVAFLIADSVTTGHVLICDGGLRLGAWPIPAATAATEWPNPWQIGNNPRQNRHWALEKPICYRAARSITLSLRTCFQRGLL
jgi:hypothetical protein